MSWTFEYHDTTQEQRTAFKTAIEGERTAGIILFNSLNDKANTNWQDFWPLKLNDVSSLATAFAAGLAGLIIYMARALPYLDDTLLLAKKDSWPPPPHERVSREPSRRLPGSRR